LRESESIIADEIEELSKVMDKIIFHYKK